MKNTELLDNPLIEEKPTTSLDPIEETVAEYRVRQLPTILNYPKMFGIFVFESLYELSKVLGAIALAILFICGAVLLFLVFPILGFQLVFITGHSVWGGIILMLIGAVAWGAMIRNENKL